MDRCKRCILPKSYPGLTFDKSGICNKCRTYERRWSNYNPKKAEEYARNMFADAKSKNNEYDCIIGLSGGKDSSYMVYLCTQKYKLKPLVYTYDNHFMSAESLSNIKKLTTALNVKHIFVKHDWELMKRLYRRFVLTTGDFCSPCNTGMVSWPYKAAKEYNIHLIISGYSPRTDMGGDINFWFNCEEYFENVTRGYFSKDEIKDFLHNKTLTRALGHLTGTLKHINLPAYVEWDEQKMVRLLEKEFDWEIIPEHYDCMGAKLKEYLHIKEVGFSERALKYSVLIRGGFMGREEALSKIEAFERDVIEDNSGFLHKVIQMLDLSEEELAEAITKRQRPYMPKFASLVTNDTLMKTLYFRH